MKIIATLAEWLAAGPNIVRLCEVDEVTITDRGPMAIGSGLGRAYAWSVESTPGAADWSCMPQALFDHLPAGGWWNESNKDAHAALGNACIAWAKATRPPNGRQVAAQRALGNACIAWAKETGGAP